jgi:hypothetical protein
MTASTEGDSGPESFDIYDENPAGLACRVCGVLVPRENGYPRVHWDWHEASNGA